MDECGADVGPPLAGVEPVPELVGGLTGVREEPGPGAAIQERARLISTPASSDRVPAS